MGALDCVSTDRMKSTESTEVFTINMASSNSCLSEPRRDLESQFSKSNSNKKNSIWWVLGVDIPLICLVAVVIGLVELGVIPSHQAGFFCNDPGIMFPFTGDTVSMVAICITIMLVPVPVLFATELIFLDSEYLDRSRVHQALRNTLWLYRSYSIGMLLNLGVIEVMKVITGMPRPTFMAICNPDAAMTCKGSEFIASFNCQPSDKFSAWFQTDSYHSFPSGHTSLSIHCGLFLAWYLQRRAFNWSHRSILIVPVLQLCLLSYAAVCSLTRISDHRHHWWDVLIGSVIGFFSVLYSVLVLSRNFSTLVSCSSEAERPLSPGLLFQRRPEMIS